MPDDGQISGWLFVDQESKTIMYVSRNGRTDDTGLPWKLLFEAGNMDAFRRDFQFKEVELAAFLRLRIDIPEANLRRWFEVRQEPQ